MPGPFLLWRKQLGNVSWEAGSVVSLAAHACGLVQVPGALQTGCAASMAVIPVLGVETGPLASERCPYPWFNTCSPTVSPPPTLQCYRTYRSSLPYCCRLKHPTVLVSCWDTREVESERSGAQGHLCLYTKWKGPCLKKPKKAACINSKLHR